ncbi:MAG: hypothetical protein LKJ90_09555 [Faecalibacterium sp.]|jgi:4-amino-4-deoxy-L-arabinose transferase-like glycosyltransferase|nr:hypothetical protein [Faecalibacterium sp.]
MADSSARKIRPAAMHASPQEQRLYVFDMAVLALSCLLRLYFWWRMPYHASLHDLGRLGGWVSGDLGEGHLGYIQYFYRFHALPDFDPTTVPCFYNPPLYHIVVALLMGLLRPFGVLPEPALKCATFVSLVCACVLVAACRLILRELPLCGAVRSAAFAFLAFFPAFYWLSFTATNDAMCMMFVVLSVLFTLRWYRIPLPKANASAEKLPVYRRKNLLALLPVALSVGLGMAAKLSAVLIAPAIAAVFVAKLWQARKRQWKQLILPFAVFGAVSLPLGLASPVRNLVRFAVPLNYVPGTHTPDEFPAGIRAAGRLLFPSFAQMSHSHLQWGEFAFTTNIWAQTIKSSLFDESFISDASASVHAVMVLLTYLALFLAAVALALFVYFLVSKNAAPLWQKLLLGGGYAVMLLSYLRFCYLFPHPWTPSFRYILAAFVLCIVGAACALSALCADKKRRWLWAGTCAAFGIFDLAATGLYLFFL